mmetsp:Transcript_49893/g.108925  ORF Transcript_49893/g.108925 Transcript_49893/m.108925 type:complete len:229 (+) Transcript_49893:372-1058(+)
MARACWAPSVVAKPRRASVGMLSCPPPSLLKASSNIEVVALGTVGCRELVMSFALSSVLLMVQRIFKNLSIIRGETRSSVTPSSRTTASAAPFGTKPSWLALSSSLRRRVPKALYPYFSTKTLRTRIFTWVSWGIPAGSCGCTGATFGAGMPTMVFMSSYITFRSLSFSVASYSSSPQVVRWYSLMGLEKWLFFPNLLNPVAAVVGAQWAVVGSARASWCLVIGTWVE